LIQKLVSFQQGHQEIKQLLGKVFESFKNSEIYLNKYL
jgi:hypothetical protein